ncbi:MAG: hypothetical protein ACRDYF_13760, partial [Acidimicrobiia bacterium]
MPVRVRNLRPKALIALSFLGVQAGLAAGPLGTGAESSDPKPADQLASAPIAISSVPASLAGA